LGSVTQPETESSATMAAPETSDCRSFMRVSFALRILRLPGA
jgi:hypothetical protein